MLFHPQIFIQHSFSVVLVLNFNFEIAGMFKKHIASREFHRSLVKEVFDALCLRTIVHGKVELCSLLERAVLITVTSAEIYVRAVSGFGLGEEGS